ncbi:MAG: hypothetical protein ABI651_15200 [Verrucomicrobiota bacterium]
MKKSNRVRAVLASILLLAAVLWLLRTPRAVGTSATLTLVTNSLIQFSSGRVFRIKNDDERAILLTDVIVETNSPTGWQAFSHTTPTHPQRLATGETKDMVVASPGGDASWRLRLRYGKDVKGPMVLLGKVDYAISHHAWPNTGFGIMAGSNSCISEAMSK